jgi:hypothetical protein
MARKPEKPMPDRQMLWSLLEYDSESGVLTWKFRPHSMFGSERIFLSWNMKMAGKPAFTCVGGNGYPFGSIWGKHYTAHRIIFKMMTGRDPVGVDHIDGDRRNNRWRNLREADQRLNARNSAMPRNNSSGHVGVYWFKERSKWFAAIKSGGKNKNLGYFDRIEDAIAARKAAETRLGFHKNHGRRPSV